MGVQYAAADSDSEDSYFDLGAIVDSDFDISDHGDDLYADNVDEDEPRERKDKEKHKGEVNAKEKVAHKGNEKVGDKGKMSTILKNINLKVKGTRFR